MVPDPLALNSVLLITTVYYLTQAATRSHTPSRSRPVLHVGDSTQKVVPYVSGAQTEGYPTQIGVGKVSPKEMMATLNLGHIADSQAGKTGRGEGKETRFRYSTCKISRQKGMWFPLGPVSSLTRPAERYHG